MEKTQLRGHFAMFGANVMWGMMSPVAKMVMSAGIVTPLLMTDLRIIGAAVLFWILSAFVPAERVPAPDLIRLGGAAFLGILFNQGCFIFGVGFTSPGEASIITTTMPMWVMALAAVILKEPITVKKVGGIMLGACGALMLVFNAGSMTGGGSKPVLGDILVFCAQFSYALYLTLYRNFIRRYSLVTLMKWMFLFAAIAITPISVQTIMSTLWSDITIMQIAGIAFVVVGATFIAYMLVMTGQKLLRPTLVGMYNYVQPVVASVIAISIGIEKFTPVKVVAVILIFGGVWLVTISKAKDHEDK